MPLPVVSDISVDGGGDRNEMPPVQQTPVVGVHRPARRGVNMSRVVWEGVDEFGQWLHDTPGIVVKDVEAALWQEGQNILGVAVRRTPVDTGFLWSGRNSKTGEIGPAPWREKETRSGKVTVMLAYGADYAIYAHEQEPRVGGQGQSKFLESAVKEGMDGMIEKLKDKIAARLKRRGL